MRSQQGKVEWMQGKVSQRKCPHQQFIDDDCSGQEFETDAYRYWTEGSASKDTEVAGLRGALGALVGMYMVADFISCITPGSRREAISKPKCQAIWDAWDKAQAVLEEKHE